MEKIYPDHIYDQTRVKIAAQFVHKEFIKLAPSLTESEWQRLGDDIERWFVGDRSDLAPVHDFWNGFHGITSGFKLKAPIRFITAQNATWSKQEVPVKDIPLSWSVPSIAKLGKGATYQQVYDYIHSSKEEYKKQKDLADMMAARFKIDRSKFPILLAKTADSYILLDGNRRTLEAIIYDRPNITAWVGDLNGDNEPKNYWIPTGFLRDILREAEAADAAGDQDALEGVVKFLQHLFKRSAIAKINWDLRCKNQSELAERLSSL